MWTHNVKWRVSLSDGSFVTEGQAYFSSLSISWRELVEDIAKRGLSITSLVLVTPDNHTLHLPSAGRNPQFVFFRETPPPVKYEVRHGMAREMDFIPHDPNDQNWEIKEWYTLAVAVYPDHELQLWVSEKDPRQSWCLSIDNETLARIKSKHGGGK